MLEPALETVTVKTTLLPTDGVKVSTVLLTLKSADPTEIKAVPGALSVVIKVVSIFVLPIKPLALLEYVPSKAGTVA